MPLTACNLSIALIPVFGVFGRSLRPAREGRGGERGINYSLAKCNFLILTVRRWESGLGWICIVAKFGATHAEQLLLEMPIPFG